VPWVGLFKICSHGSEILNIIQTGSEKPQKLVKYLKIFSRTINATGEQKTALKSIRGPFTILLEATSCDECFSNYASERLKV
jgi:hypothetical protein